MYETRPNGYYYIRLANDRVFRTGIMRMWSNDFSRSFAAMGYTGDLPEGWAVGRTRLGIWWPEDADDSIDRMEDAMKVAQAIAAAHRTTVRSVERDSRKVWIDVESEVL
ncbi:hypothetical protein [Rhodococcoides yunnanense]|uniref:Uncharacterized protein n=1 Tax=Rhodococcoides yunnanense TaxID=278209 RepID=A0ABU4BEC8_9NOCA|nr:hypothetical protein [Rhodococcus yunnanensis]MDV6262546.1 hypothetical protein [Rhodococcus yunnanensis]